MGLFDPHQIANLVGQIGGDHQGAAQMLQGLAGQGQQIDTNQHGDMLQQMGIDPQHLDNGGYQQHLDAQNQSGFQGYQQGQDLGGGQQSFDRQDYQQDAGFGGGQDQGYQQQGNY